MKRCSLFFLLPALILMTVAVAQRGGPPRRIESPETIHLDSGARVDFLSFHSPALGKSAEYSIFLPASYHQDQGRRYPVVFFLHGMFNDHTSWAVERYGNIPKRLDALMQQGEIPPFLLVHPNGENSFYTNYLDGSLKYENMIYGDLVKEVSNRFRTLEGKKNRSIGGVSMGGYGSLKIAFKQPDLYGSVAAVSPIVFLGDPSRQIMASNSRLSRYLARLLEPVYGMPFTRHHWQANSLETLANQAEIEDLNIYFCYGTADRYNDAFPMEAGIKRLDQILTQRNIRHVLKIYEDQPHGWELVTLHLEEVFSYLSKEF